MPGGALWSFSCLLIDGSHMLREEVLQCAGVSESENSTPAPLPTGYPSDNLLSCLSLENSV